MSDSPAVPFFKKKSKSSSSTASSPKASTSKSTSTSADPSTSATIVTKIRKRSVSPAEDVRDVRHTKMTAHDEGGGGPSVIRGKKRQAYNPLKQGTAGITKRLKQHEDDEGDFDDVESAIGVTYADRGRTGMGYGRDNSEQDSTGVFSGDAALAKSGEQGDQANAADGLYHGQAKYAAQLPTGSAKYAPIKGPNANIKTITLVDYQPDVCKDYKETGWCGFGDSCKFLHDRGDYLHGWQMDSILSQPATAAVAEVVEEELPFACLICREPFGAAPHDPVVTRCGHYFGSSCAIKRFAKNPRCFACGAGTQGLFSKAQKILERKEKAQQERIRQREVAEGKPSYEDEEEDGGVEIEGLAEG